MILVRKFLHILKFMILPMMAGVFPVLFLYGNNTAKLLLPSLGRSLLFYAILALFAFIMAFLLLKAQVIQASNAAFAFLLFFHVYGIVYRISLEKDVLPAEHYILLPPFFLTAIYFCWFATKGNPIKFWKTAVTILGCLVALNLVKIVSGEIGKWQMANEQSLMSTENTRAEESLRGDDPDIYFIIFDEFAGFDVAKDYWGYQEVDEFINFVQSKGFFVAEDSRSSSTVTLHIMAELFNYEQLPIDPYNINIYYNDINDSRAVNYLKSRGYTTVTFDETPYWYETYTPMPADYSFYYDDSNKVSGLGVYFDEFGVLIAENTMLKPLEAFYKSISPEPLFLEQHREYIFFTADKIGQLSKIPSPKFVYVHLMIPHNPFIFDANGDPIDPKMLHNWNYYLDQYIFTIKIMEKMINNILLDADPKRPPVIIVQSDHGVRNIMYGDDVVLEDYPDDYKTQILNILFLPGFDTSQLPQDLKPINTFPIVFNHYLDADIPLIK